MEANQDPQTSSQTNISATQSTVSPFPNVLDENTVVLSQEDIDKIPKIIQLFRLVNGYKKAPIYRLEKGEDYHRLNYEKTGDLMSDMNRDKFQDIMSLYGDVKPNMKNFIFYYGRNIKPIKFEYDPSWPGKLSPYGEVIYMKLGYRNLEQFVPNYEEIRDYVLKAIEWYYRNDPSRGDIVTILKRKMSDLTGNQYLALLKENRRRIEYDKQLEDLY